MNQTFRAHERLNRAEDFFRARKKGRRFTGKHLTVWILRRDDVPARASRLGVVVGRKHGIAVRRNLFKRRMREIFRLHKEKLARGLDIIVSPRLEKPVRLEKFPTSFENLRRDFLGLARPFQRGS